MIIWMYQDEEYCLVCTKKYSFFEIMTAKTSGYTQVQLALSSVLTLAGKILGINAISPADDDEWSRLTEFLTGFDAGLRHVMELYTPIDSNFMKSITADLESLISCSLSKGFPGFSSAFGSEYSIYKNYWDKELNGYFAMQSDWTKGEYIASNFGMKQIDYLLDSGPVRLYAGLETLSE